MRYIWAILSSLILGFAFGCSTPPPQPEKVDAAFVKDRDSLLSCYQNNPSDGGKLFVNFDVLLNDDVSHLVVTSNDSFSSKMKLCVSDIVQKMNFGRQQGPLHVKYPISYKRD